MLAAGGAGFCPGEDRDARDAGGAKGGLSGNWIGGGTMRQWPGDQGLNVSEGAELRFGFKNAANPGWPHARGVMRCISAAGCGR